jgi:exonuclease SbcC
MLKLVSLKVSGFKRLDLQDKITFPDGRLLIHGRNESGKSTIMEAIHYAFYGFALRPTKRAGKEDLISYGKPSAVIELEFSIDDETYQIRREIKRKGANVHILNKRDPDGSLSRVTSNATPVNSHILEILHGIDSDALLNSCLVEQKELGKLEASNKQDRIKAMSNLLNLEEFVDAREELRKDRSNLEKTSKDTKLRLQEAKQGSEAYEEAEENKARAEKRLDGIEAEQKDAESILEILEKELSILSEMRILKTGVEAQTLVIREKRKQKTSINLSLDEANKATDTLDELGQLIPESEQELHQARERLDSIETLIGWNRKLEKASSDLKYSELGLEEINRSQIESREASEKLIEVSEKIEEFKPAKKAEALLPTIINQINDLNEAATAEKNLQFAYEETQIRLNELSDSQETAERLVTAEQDIDEAIEAAQKKRNMAFGALGLGVGGLAAYSLSLFFAVIGVILLVAGAFLYQQGNTVDYTQRKIEVRVQSNEIMGEVSRIKEYKDSLKTLEQQIEESRERKNLLDEQINENKKQLPDSPRAYSILLNHTDESIEKARKVIQDDLKQLALLEAEERNIKTLAVSFDEKTKELETIKAETLANQKIVDELHGKIREKEEAIGFTVQSETEIRDEYSTTDRKLAELNSKRGQVEENLKNKPELDKNLFSINEEIQDLEKKIEENSTKLYQLIETNGLELEDEEKKQTEKETAQQKLARMGAEFESETEKVLDSVERMEKTAKLKEEYPQLKEEVEREIFRLEAMRHAITLLDITRNGIMSGIKQNVEKNMIQFLPTLTDNRYNRVQIDDERYVIEVWNREAKTWKGKGVFSGATQDQFSLALRLAFAISTIPSSKGARPGFIFLDEPLSGFDTQRRAGFMLLLREELSKHFPQIIVISHIEALREDFQHHLTLDSGKIIELQR